MTDPRDRVIPVLVVGGGPVGLALAAELGWRGIACMLVEQSDGVLTSSKMNLVNVRTMEHCRRWGIADAVRATPFPPDFPHDVAFVTDLNGHELARLRRPADKDRAPSEASPETWRHCPQIWFDPVMQRFASSLPAVTLKYRCRLESLVQDTDCVRAEVADLATGSRETISARYLVGCDGGASTIRGLIGIPMEGTRVLGRPLNVFFRCPAFFSMHDKPAAIRYMHVDEDGVWATLVAINGTDLWRLSLADVPEGTDPADIDVHGLLRRAMGRDFDYELTDRMPWTRRKLVAARYRDGRVFLAGDAAHQLSTTGGFGMNTGIGDAVDLGWKLAGVVAGWGGEELLASYDAERRPIGIRNVNEAAANFDLWNLPQDGTALTDDTPAGARRRRALGEALAEALRREFETEGVQLGYRYDPSPVCVPDGTPAPPDDPRSYVPTARPGSRAPHAWLDDGRSTIDLFGAGFTLLRLGADAPAADGLLRAAASRGVPLGVETVDAPAARDLYERQLVLVRPDGHVAWRGDAAPDDPLTLIDRVRGAPVAAARAAAE